MGFFDQKRPLSPLLRLTFERENGGLRIVGAERVDGLIELAHYLCQTHAEWAWEHFEGCLDGLDDALPRDVTFDQIKQLVVLGRMWGAVISNPIVGTDYDSGCNFETVEVLKLGKQKRGRASNG